MGIRDGTMSVSGKISKSLGRLWRKRLEILVEVSSVRRSRLSG